MNFSIIKNELLFKATRSSGAGGQHVNKVSSKIELAFDILASNGLSEKEKTMLIDKLTNRITKGSILILTCQETRSQHKNKEIVIQRLFNLLKESLTRKKYRIQTKPTRSSIKKKAENKRKNSLKKALRKKPRID